MTKAALLLLCVLIVPLSGCQECGRELFVGKTENLAREEPISLDPAHVQEHAPALYALLEKALVEGAATTDDDRKIDASTDYLQEWHNAKHPTVEYRGTILQISGHVC